MKHQLKFYPVGNGDCSLLKLDSGKTILFDFRHTCKCEDDNEPEVDLISQIEMDLDGKKEVDILVITHTDDDHIGCYMISSSKPILNEDSVQPPHFQAQKYYKDCLIDNDGKFLVTMESPNEINPLISCI